MVDASTVLTGVTSFLSGGVVGTLVSYRTEAWKARRERRIKMIDLWRTLLTDDLCRVTVYVGGAASKVTFPGMDTEAFASLYPHLSHEFRQRLDSPIMKVGGRRDWPKDYLRDEISSIERRWRLI